MRTGIRTSLAGLLACAMLPLALGGCSTDRSTEESLDETTPAGQTQEPQSPHPSPSSLQPSVQEVTVDELMVYTGELGVDSDSGAVWTAGPHTVVLESEGTNQQVSLKIFGDSTKEPGYIQLEPSGEREYLATAYSPQLSESESAGVAIVTLEKLPADGLQAGDVEFIVRTFDESGAQKTEASIPADDATELDSVRLIGQYIALFEDRYSDAENNVFVYDIESGSKVWATFCEDSNEFEGTPNGLLALSCYKDSDSDEESTRELNGISILDGSIVWKYGREVAAPISVYVSDASLDGSFLSIPYETSEQDGYQLVDIRDGSVIADGPTYGVDPISNLAVIGADLYWNSEGETVVDYGLRIVDTKTHEVTFELSAGELEALDTFESLAVYDNRLWFEGPNGIDIGSLKDGSRDGQYSPIDTGNPEVGSYPVAAGDTWVILQQVNNGPDLLIRTDAERPSIADIADTWGQY